MDTTLSHNQRLARKYKGSRGRKTCWDEEKKNSLFIPRYRDTVLQPKRQGVLQFLEQSIGRLKKEPFVIYETNKPSEKVSKIIQAAGQIGIRVKCAITIGGIKVFLVKE